MSTNILLVCNEGMSTSYLVKKMQDIASENKLKVNIKAIGEPHVDEESKTADVILLGPQIAFMRDAIHGRIGDRIPVEPINPEDFGRINAANVLKTALTLIRENRQKGK
ncbi:PTS sugar transporter subunit IIB [Lactovum odontotermitis]